MSSSSKYLYCLKRTTFTTKIDTHDEFKNSIHIFIKYYDSDLHWSIGELKCIVTRLLSAMQYHGGWNLEMALLSQPKKGSHQKDTLDKINMILFCGRMKFQVLVVKAANETVSD